MYTDVYVDVLFLINFSMDAISLYLTSRLCALRLRVFRVSLAAVFGAIFSVGSVFLDLNPLISIVLTLLFSVLMVYIAFDFNALVEGIKYTAVFYVSSSLLGGIISAMYTVLSDLCSGVSIDNPGKLSIPLFAALVIVSLILALFLTRLHGSGNMPSKVRVKVSILKKSFETEAIVDTGNLLSDPITNKSVIIIRAGLMHGILSDMFIKGAMTLDMSLAYKLSSRDSSLFRLIPASSISGAQFLFGVKADSVTLYIQKNGKDIVLERDAVIALSGNLTEEVNCIVPSSII